MHSSFERVERLYGVQIVEGANAWRVRISRAPQVEFAISIPIDVLEWFLSARDETGTIWSEWCDYYPTQGETREQMRQEMLTDIENLVRKLVKLEMRVVRESQATFIEFRVDEDWRQASLSCLLE